jgi:hypothetical protein
MKRKRKQLLYAAENERERGGATRASQQLEATAALQQ